MSGKSKKIRRKEKGKWEKARNKKEREEGRWKRQEDKKERKGKVEKTRK